MSTFDDSRGRPPRVARVPRQSGSARAEPRLHDDVLNGDADRIALRSPPPEGAGKPKREAAMCRCYRWTITTAKPDRVSVSRCRSGPADRSSRARSPDRRKCTGILRRSGSRLSLAHTDGDSLPARLGCRLRRPSRRGSLDRRGRHLRSSRPDGRSRSRTLGHHRSWRRSDRRRQSLDALPALWPDDSPPPVQRARRDRSPDVPPSRALLQLHASHVSLRFDLFQKTVETECMRKSHVECDGERLVGDMPIVFLASMRRRLTFRLR
jgi:hypothetical protein